jgi:hypothetical protein
MDERLTKALEFSNFLETQNNQKRIFLAQYKDNLIHYTHGHKFTVTPELISFCQSLIALQLTDIWLIDDNDIPFNVTNLEDFTRELVGVYIVAARKYGYQYKTIKQNRSVQGLVDL